MSGWKKLEVKDLDLDLEKPGKASGHSKSGASIEDLDTDALKHQAHRRESTKPLEIWATYRTYRENQSGMPVGTLPEWILEYLDQVAARLHKAKPGGDVRKLCQSALGISGKDLAKSAKPDRKKPKRRKKGK